VTIYIVTCLVEYPTYGSVVPKELGKGVSLKRVQAGWCGNESIIAFQGGTRGNLFAVQAGSVQARTQNRTGQDTGEHRSRTVIRSSRVQGQRKGKSSWTRMKNRSNWSPEKLQWTAVLIINFRRNCSKTNKTNSVALSPQANYTDWATAICWRNLEPAFADRGGVAWSARRVPHGR
jgi:hypothetical protein